MATLRLLFFDRPSVYLDDEPFHQNLPDKAIALLCYLAITRTAHPRTKLANLLWGNKPEKRARNNLSIIRNKLGELAPFVAFERKTIGLDWSKPLQIDVASVEDAVARLDANDLPQLQRAADLYTGSLLENFRLSDEDGAQDFLEWVSSQQVRLEEMARKLFHTLAVRYFEARDLPAAIGAAQREVELDTWREEAHRQLMLLYAHVGDREQAINQYRVCVEVLRSELEVDVSAETRRLYESIVAETLETLEMISAAPFEAPALPAYFVGRDTIVTQAEAQLAAATTPVVALVGMGGIGKSTAASFLAHHWRGRYPDGVLWTHADDEDLFHVLHRWAERYDRDVSHLKSLANRVNAMRDILAEKRILVIFDNATKVRAIRSLMPAMGDSLLIVTTRQHDVAAALNAAVMTLNVLQLSDGVQLFQEIVGEERVSAEMDAAHQICELLEHLPLALEIAAQRLRARPRYSFSMLAMQLEQLQSRLPVLQIGDRAVRVSFEASWTMLPDEFRNLYRALAVFDGRSFNAVALAAVMQQEDLLVVSGLIEVAALSLVTPLADQRYRQHALLADFALEKATDLAADQQRMVDYFVAYAGDWASEPSALQVEWHNLSAALSLAYNEAQWQAVLDLTQTLSPSVSRLGHYHDARVLLPLARTAAKQLDSSAQEAQILLNWGIVCIEQNDYEEATSLLEDALHLAQAIDNQQVVSDVFLNLARLAIERSEREQAHQWLIDAQKIKERLQDAEGLGLVYYRLARLYMREGGLDSAEQYCRRAIKLQESLNLKSDQLQSTQILVGILIERELFLQAYQLSKQALEQARTLNDYDLRAVMLYMVLVCAVRCKDYDCAIAIAEECLPLLVRMGLKKQQGQIYYELSRLKRTFSMYHDALDLVDQSITLFETTLADYSLVYAYRHRGKVLMNLERIEEARTCWQVALDYALPIRHPATPTLRNLLVA